MAERAVAVLWFPKLVSCALIKVFEKAKSTSQLNDGQLGSAAKQQEIIHSTQDLDRAKNVGIFESNGASNWESYSVRQ